MGLWYEAEKYPFIFEIGGKCITATYGPAEDGNVTVTNYQFNQMWDERYFLLKLMNNIIYIFKHWAGEQNWGLCPASFTWKIHGPISLSTL